MNEEAPVKGGKKRWSHAGEGLAGDKGVMKAA